MVEALVAMTIIVGGLLGIFTLLSRSLNLNRVVANQYAGANLAAEGIELVKNLIDRNVMQGLSFNSGSCLTVGDHSLDYNDTHASGCGYRDSVLLFDQNGHYSYDQGDPATFRRTITIGQPAPNEIKVTSRVTWINRGDEQFEITLEDHFFNWR